ncbi:COP9 signalosome complex subunit 3 [Bienertia sinuspersici]
MDAVERVVTNIERLSGSVADLNQLHNILKQSEDSLRLNSSRLSPFLHQLDPSIHSLGYLYFLDAYTASVSRDEANEAVLLVARFIGSCSAEQIRLVPHKFVGVCKRFKDQVMVLSAPMRGVAPLLTAIHKIRPSPEHLTTLHPDFLLLCILAKCYKTGLSVLEDDVFEVVTAPMPTLNAIAVEAYKKYILVSLIRNGQFSTHFPKYTSSVGQRSLKNFTQIQDGHIYATINQKDGMVRFLEDPEQYKTCEMIEHIDSSIQR